jgi:hypothetical protein
VVGELGTVLRTTDGGQTWVPQASGVSETLLAVSFTDTNNGSAVGQLGVIIRTTDGGQSWIRQSSGTNQDLYNVTFTQPELGTAVGGFGAILRAEPTTTNTCPIPLTHWRDDPDHWPVETLTLGSQSYDKSELLEIVNTRVNASGERDASLLLAHQLIAARLNVANGSDPAPVTGTLEDADTLLGGYAGKLPYGVELSSPAGRAMSGDASVLKDYNHGNLTPGCGP